MNNCIFSGRLTNDPEVRYSANGETAITRFRLAVNRRFKREGEPDADFLNILAFGKSAENIGKYFKKGSMIILETHVQTGSYENREGQKVYTTDFVVDSWDFAGSSETKSEKPKEEPKAKDGELVPVPESDNLPWD